MGSVIFGFELLVNEHKVFFPFLQLDFDYWGETAV